MSPSAMSGFNAQISEALRLARAGDYLAAESICSDIMRREPNNAGAIMLSGIIAASRGENEKAAPLFERVIALHPRRADAHFNLGLIRVRQGRQAEAVASFEAALKIDPANIDAAAAHAEALLGLQRWREAVQAIDVILSTRPDVADIWLKRGAALDTLGDYTAALASYRRAEELAPYTPVTKEVIGAILVRFARYREAIEILSQAIALGHRTADIFLQRAFAHSSLGERDKALADFASAHAADPAHRRVLIYYTECLHRDGRVADAEGVLRKAREHDPIGARVLLGQLYSDLRRNDEALAAFAEAETLGVDDFIIPWARTLHNLRLGNFTDGLHDFDARLRGSLGEFGKTLPGAEWQPGSGGADHRLLVYAEQGFGDTIQFARYVPELIERGHDVVLQVQRPLIELFRSLHRGVTVVSRADPLPAFDARISIASLLARSETRLETIPPHVPYLRPSPSAREAWAARAASLKGPLVGVSWSGSPTHERDAARSIAFADFKRLFDVHGATFVSLQRDPRPDEKAEVEAELRLVDFTAHLTDFNETAALIETLDLVVTVDTSIAHLAGALNKPVWTLLAAAGDWRWFWDREDSPWYPSARLFRQSVYGDWSDVLDRVANELRNFGKR